MDLALLPEERLPAGVESALYCVVAEALSNATRHSDASQCTVKVARDDGLALVEVKDDGVGGADARQGNGLRAIADRVAALDGSLELVSAPGEGTIVYAEIPCA